jgi:hypothetical protein
MNWAGSRPVDGDRTGPYPVGAFDAAEGELQGISCPVPSAEAELDVRENFHRHPCGAPLQEIDGPIIAKLRKYLENT